ncbi:hypothetical protein J2T57_002193 [Natronocella acetinitrilica]|jgi:lipid A 3-O-deacylase|uniref:DUF2219 family protein n=1 Tax=Natronocella acetinitrilica TaxID=414046 RepID=A0AAE3G3C0_9GAMM|nr:lipid A deacylase LpxR family protein [Natronocella acetinitrilica]MCP1675045.1 hypothetical protein [Natronocella acetinitrilica]
MSRASGLRLATLLAALVWLHTAMAQDPTWGTLTLEHENDLFAGEDRYYTSGVRVTWLSPDDRVPGWVRRGSEWVPMFNPDGELKLSYSIGQNMYTASDITLADPPENDRPYAGWLYATVGLGSQTPTRLDRLQLSLGVIGPASLADRTQRQVHRHLDAPQPAGWDTQLRNEPAVLLTYERQWREFAGRTSDGWGWDFTPYLGGSLGNVFTQLTTGITGRLGWRMMQDWGPPRIQPALPGSGIFRARSDLGGYVFVSLDGRAVARDIFLDGNSFRNSRSVEKRNLVGEIQVGMVVNVSRRVRLAYTHVFPSREFRGQTGTQDFGSFSLSAHF